MSNHTYSKEIAKFLKIQLLEVEGISLTEVRTEQNSVYFEIEDLEGSNFGFPENIGLRVKVEMFKNSLNHLRTSSNFYKYEKGLEGLLEKEPITAKIRETGPIDFWKDSVPEVNLRNLNLNPTNLTDVSISLGTIREAKQLNHLIKEQLFLDMNDLGSNYIKFSIKGYDDIRYTKDTDFNVKMYFYRDDIYNSAKNISYAGTLVVFFTKNDRLYGVDGAFKYAVTYEQLKKGNLFSYKEIFDAISSGRKQDHDFRKVVQQ